MVSHSEAVGHRQPVQLWEGVLLVRNVELKARLRDREWAITACHEIGAAYQGDTHQTDTYFRVPAGRFKLRVSDPGDDYLVFYRRPDVLGPKGCEYIIQRVDRRLGDLLGAALGVVAVVEKTRTLYLWQNVRIHLDHVTQLGDFVEFEAVLPEDPGIFNEADGYKKVARLQGAFGIRPEDLIDTSYLELAERFSRHDHKVHPAKQ